MPRFRRLPAFGLLEVIFSSALVALVSLALFSAFIPDINQSSSNIKRQQALGLAKEGLAAARAFYVQDEALLIAGTYGLYYSSPSWSLGAAPDSADGFDRYLEISDSASGRQAVARIRWSVNGQPYELFLEQEFSYSASSTTP
jgi:hypothetical protein